MPDYTVSADVDSMLRSANDAAIRSAIGVGTTDVPTFNGLTATGTLNFSGTGSRKVSRINAISQENAFILDDSYGNLAVTARNVSVLDNDGVSGEFWFKGTGFKIGGDTILRKDAAGILAQRNGTSAQAFRVYNSTDATPATNYDRGVFDFKTTTNTLRIGTEKGGTYTTARPIEFVTGDVVRMSITAAGSITTTGDFYVNPLGLSGKIFVGIGSTGGIRFDASGQPRGTIFAVLDGVFAFTSSTQNDFNRLQLGGTTSAFPAIKRNGTGIDIRLADDSAFAALGVARLDVAAGGQINLGATSSKLYVASGAGLRSAGAGIWLMFNDAENDFNRLQLGGTTSAFPSIKRSTTSLQARLADDSAFTNIQGKITTDTAYTATVVTPTGFLTLYDSTGTAYRVPCVV